MENRLSYRYRNQDKPKDTREKKEIIVTGKVPTHEEVDRMFEYISSKRATEYANSGMGVFLNIYTGKINIELYEEGAEGICIMNPIELPNFINAIGVSWAKGGDMEEFIFFIQKAVDKRVQALANLYDFPDEINYEKVARQFAHGVFREEELPFIVFIDMINTLIDQGKNQLLGKVITRLSTAYLNKILIKLDEYDIHLTESLLKIMSLEDKSDKNKDLAKIILDVVHARLDSVKGSVIDPRESSSIIKVMDTMNFNLAWADINLSDPEDTDEKSLRNIKALETLNGRLAKHTFQLNDDAVEKLIGDHSLEFVITMLNKGKDTYLKNLNTSQVKKYMFERN